MNELHEGLLGRFGSYRMTLYFHTHAIYLEVVREVAPAAIRSAVQVEAPAAVRDAVQVCVSH